MKEQICFLIFSLVLSVSFKAEAQQRVKSIHQEQSEFYSSQKELTETEFDSLNGRRPQPELFSARSNSPCVLTKRVLGWHPYWNGTTYTNYQWNLLSDLVYFDYSVSPTTGNNTNTSFAWTTASVVTVAKNNNTKVHICVTLFGGHSSFWASSSAQNTLISNLVNLLNARGGNGINIDFEGMGSSDNAPFVAFMTNLNNALNAANPNYQLSVCLYAVDWGNSFNITALNPLVDFYTIMGYDYYYAGSTTAGPTAPLYNFETNYNYTLGRTISYYMKQGAPASKLLMGLPYYGREWEVNGTSVPATTTGNFNASRTLLAVNNNTANYNTTTKFWEGNCYSPYYKYNSGTSTRQCWIDDVYSLGRKYDMVNQRGLGGIGIWALGYDDGLSGYWNLIRDKFSDCAPIVCSDSLFDMGGPTRNYYNDERYQFTLSAPTGSVVRLQFKSFGTEYGYDSLWLYNGANSNAPLIGSYTGTNTPGTVTSSGTALTLRFKSDGATVSFGYKALKTCVPVVVSQIKKQDTNDDLSVYPNPVTAGSFLTVIGKESYNRITIRDTKGLLVMDKVFVPEEQIQLPTLPSGLYLVCLIRADGAVRKPIKLLVH